MFIQRFVHSSTDRHLVCFYILPVTNNALNLSVLNRLLITGFVFVLGNKFILPFGCSKLCSSPTLVGVVGRALGSTELISLPLCPESNCISHKCLQHRRATLKAVSTFLDSGQVTEVPSPFPFTSVFAPQEGFSLLSALGTSDLNLRKEAAAEGKRSSLCYCSTLSKSAKHCAFQQHCLLRCQNKSNEGVLLVDWLA